MIDQPIVANPKRQPAETAVKPGAKSGMDAINELERLAEKKPDPQETARQVLEEIAAVRDYVEQEVILPAGWRLRQWNQGHLMSIFEDGAITKATNGEYGNRWRRNFEVVMSVLRCGGYDVVNDSIKEDDILAMHWQDVEQLALGTIAHYQNTVLIKKK